MIKRKCVNCIFFNKINSQKNCFSIESEVRENLDLLEKSFEQYSINCYKGHWDTGNAPTLKSDIYRIVSKKRKKYECSFVPYEKGKMYFAAEDTLKLIEVNRARNTAKIGIVISIISLLISLEIINLSKLLSIFYFFKVLLNGIFIRLFKFFI